MFGKYLNDNLKEGVKWHVGANVFLKISPEHYNDLKKVMLFNSRLTQPLFYPADPDWVVKRSSDYKF